MVLCKILKFLKLKHKKIEVKDTPQYLYTSEQESIRRKIMMNQILSKKEQNAILFDLRNNHADIGVYYDESGTKRRDRFQVLKFLYDKYGIEDIRQLGLI